MNLSYRGAAYRATATAVAAMSSELIGRYRGQPCRRSHFDVSVTQPRITLKYRGVSYMTGTQPSSSTVEPVALNIKAVATDAVTDFKQRVQSELEKVHSLSIQKNLKRRLDVARHQGNQGLVQLLEEEKRQLVS